MHEWCAHQFFYAQALHRSRTCIFLSERCGPVKRSSAQYLAAVMQAASRGSAAGCRHAHCSTRRPVAFAASGRASGLALRAANERQIGAASALPDASEHGASRRAIVLSLLGACRSVPSLLPRYELQHRLWCHANTPARLVAQALRCWFAAAPQGHRSPPLLRHLHRSS